MRNMSQYRRTWWPTPVSQPGLIREAEPLGFMIWISLMQLWDLVKQSVEGCCLCVWAWGLRWTGQGRPWDGKMDVTWRKQRWTGTPEIKLDSKRLGWKPFWSLAASRQLPWWDTSKEKLTDLHHGTRRTPGRGSKKVEEAFPKGWTGSFAVKYTHISCK